MSPYMTAYLRVEGITREAKLSRRSWQLQVYQDTQRVHHCFDCAQSRPDICPDHCATNGVLSIRFGCRESSNQAKTCLPGPVACDAIGTARDGGGVTRA